jgi:hypothetical protein
MGIAPERLIASSVHPLRIHSRALRALPLTALALDLTLVTTAVLLAAYGRSKLLVFDSSPALSQSTGGPTLAQGVTLIAIPMIIAWIGLIALRGG